MERATLISKILLLVFIENFQKNYSYSASVIIDEMLCPFRGCSLFRNMKFKTVKYGINVMCLRDAEFHYLYNAFIYTGKQPLNTGRNGKSLPTQSVLQ